MSAWIGERSIGSDAKYRAIDGTAVATLEMSGRFRRLKSHLINLKKKNEK